MAMLLKKMKIFVSKIFNYFENFKDILFIYSLIFFLFFRLKYLFKLNINFLVMFILIIFITFVVFKKIEFIILFFKNSAILNYIFYNFIIFKELIYLSFFEDFNFSFKENLYIFSMMYSLGSLIPMLLYRCLDYPLFNILIFFIFFFYKILTMFEGFIIKKYFKKEDLISYANIQHKLKINNNLKFPYERYNLINIHRRYFVIPTIAGLKFKNILMEKAAGLGASAGLGAITFYAYDSYHKRADREVENKKLEIAEKNFEITEKNFEIAEKNFEITEKNFEVTQKKAKEEIFLAKYHHLKKEKNEAELSYIDCKNSWSLFNNTEEKKAFSKKNMEEASLALENIKKDAAKEGITLYSVFESSFFN